MSFKHISHCSTGSIVEFEQVNAGLEGSVNNLAINGQCLSILPEITRKPLVF